MPRSGVSAIKQEEPAFLKKFKEKIGYQEGPDVESKREKLPMEEDDREDRDDEQPVVVVLKDGDLNAEEAETIQKQLAKEDVGKGEDEDETQGKIVFKKPAKRSAEKESDLFISSSKQVKHDKKKKEKSSTTGKMNVKNSNLLSFDEEDYDDT